MRAGEARRRARGPTARPIAVEPVAETSGTLRVVDQRLAEPRAPPSTAEQAGAAPSAEARGGAVEQRLRGQRGQRRLLRRLPDHGIAADQRQRRIPRPDRDREVERGDDAVDAERMPGLHHAMVARARWRWSGRRAGATGRRRSRRCRSSPGLRRGPSVRILPASMVTSRPRSALAARSSSPNSRTSSPRRGAGTSRHRERPHARPLGAIHIAAPRQLDTADELS